MYHENYYQHRRGATENGRGLHRHLRFWPLSKNYGKAEEGACCFALYSGLGPCCLWIYMLGKHMKGGLMLADRIGVALLVLIQIVVSSFVVYHVLNHTGWFS